MQLPPDAVTAARLPFGRAATLPADAYVDPAVYAAEVERIFRREWLCVARSDQVASPGDYLSVDLLGEPLVVTRDADEELHVLSRVCRHRGAEIVRGAGSAKSLRCPYHAWVYGLDGSLLGAPHMDDAGDFDPTTCALPSLRCEVWEGWIFANFDAQAKPLSPRLATLSRALARYRLDEYRTLKPLEFESRFGWKVLTDNFMEAYHHVATHRDTLQPLFPAGASYALESDGPWSLLVMPSRDAPKRPEPPTAWPDSALAAACVFPSHLFAPTHGLLSWYQILPETAGRFSLRIHVCVPPELVGTPQAEGLRDFTKRVHLEDIGACEAVWAGLQAPSYRAGLLAPLELPLWQFNQWWLARMTGERAR